MRRRFRVTDVRSLPKKGITQVNLIERDIPDGILSGFIAIPIAFQVESDQFKVGRIFDVTFTPAE